MNENTISNTTLSKRIEALEGKIRKYSTIGVLSGLLLGGGGMLGAAQWMYVAPLDKKIKTYDSAMVSLKTAIDASKESGAVEETTALRKELVDLDRSYRRALGLIAECMEILSSRGLDARWLRKASIQLQDLQRQKTPVSDSPTSL
ncbi:MAG: hypothetical protein ACR2PS_03685 [Pseudomonadales bacterium]